MNHVKKLFLDIYPNQNPGASAYVRDGSVDIVDAFGSADLTKRIPMSTNHEFDIASLSKQFTAFAIFKLADQNKISIDDEVSKYLNHKNSFQKNSIPVRIRDLIFHTSSLKNYTSANRSECFNTNSDVLEWLKNQELKFSPGEKGCNCTNYEPGSNYSNSNYVLLAMIIEKICDSDLDGALKKLVFHPLEMHSTHVDTIGNFNNKRPVRYPSNRTICSSNAISTSGDGAIFSNIIDFSKWIKSLSVLSKTNPVLFRKYITPGKLANGKFTRYAYGWQVHETGGDILLYHDGKWNGATSCAMHWVNRDASIVIFSHTDEPTAYDSAEKIADVLKLKY